MFIGTKGRETIGRSIKNRIKNNKDATKGRGK
jgi:hypothetical protein